MRILCCGFLAVALLAASCQKEQAAGGETPVVPGTIPADFNWETTRNTAVTVNLPSVEGAAPGYAVVRIYVSPVLAEQNLVAQGVTKASAPFTTAFAVPTDADDLYVETTLPDGTKAVSLAKVQTQVNVSPVMQRVNVSSPMSRAAITRAESQIELPAAPAKYDKESDFDAQAIIRTIPASNQLGASWSFYPAARYLVPAGVTLSGAFDFNGGFQPFAEPVLYVAGKLSMPTAGFGKASLVVLPGGEVEIGTVSTNGAGNLAIYVFEGGKLSLESINAGNKTIVNQGTLTLGADMDLNNACQFYNTGIITGQAVEIKLTNSVKFFNDGTLTCAGLKMNSTSEFYNYANATLTVHDQVSLDNNVILHQDGRATLTSVNVHGILYVNCYTKIGELESQSGRVNIAAGAALEVEDVRFNNTTVTLASHAMFIAENYNADKVGGKNMFVTMIDANAGVPVVKLTGKAYTRKGKETTFSGAMEVVYDNDADQGYVINAKYLESGAVLRKEQTTVITPGTCNGNQPPIKPEPTPEPTDEYTLSKGLEMTYCLEDTWPWLGDYDMNDLVVVTRIDRMATQDGSRVKSIEINWVAKAAGTKYGIAFALQLNDMLSTQVASVSSTHTGFGAGAFQQAGLESDVQSAVIALFNNTKEVLSAMNTWVGVTPAPTTTYKTIVTFTTPVAASQLLAHNFFATVNNRKTEIHMPAFQPTEKMELQTGHYLPGQPYKFYVAKGEQMQHNNMMWMLAIPGNFRYPSEGNDIRTVYPGFQRWATSGGQSDTNWYEEDADESKIYK